MHGRHSKRVGELYGSIGGRGTVMHWSYGTQVVLLAVLYFAALANVVLLSIGLGPSAPQPQELTLVHYQEVVTSARIVLAFVTSLKLATATAVITIPIAFLSARFVLALPSPLFRMFVGGLIL